MKTTSIFARLVAFGMALSAVACLAQKSPDAARNEKVIRQYYAAYEQKDWHLLEEILADGFTFTSPAGDDHISLKVYKERCWPNAANTRKFDLEKVIIDGDEAFVTYNGWTNDGRLFRNTEFLRLKEGKIISDECFFGTGVSFPNNHPKK